MSLCQTKNYSCGSCCGLFNIDYPYLELKKILTERTEYFFQKVRFTKRHSVIAYREEFEKKESTYPKKDIHTYNCPFLGFIDLEKKKIGCMIHPVKTGDPKSQNFSFYGASICQTYDCKNKERKYVIKWESFLSSIELNWYKYSLLSGDHILFTRIEEFFEEVNVPLSKIFESYHVILKKILFKRLEISCSITSFELEMDANPETSKFQKLIEYLELSNIDPLYKEIINIKVKRE